MKNLFALKVKPGFTLAEVLITLGIIGVVAALTIPTLIADYKFRQYSTKFKKFVSTINQAGRMSQEKFGFGYEDLTDGANGYCTIISYNTLESISSMNPEVNNLQICALFNGTLAGFSYVDTNTIIDKYDNDSSIKSNINGHYGIALNDGSIFWVSDTTNNIYVDVNGPNRGPNKLTGCEGRFFLRDETCKVNNKNIGDIYILKRQKDSYIPADAVDMEVFNRAK